MPDGKRGWSIPGHIKRNLKTDGFLIRGQTGVNREKTSLFATCFNLARMITILGVSGLIERLIISTSNWHQGKLTSLFRLAFKKFFAFFCDLAIPPKNDGPQRQIKG